MHICDALTSLQHKGKMCICAATVDSVCVSLKVQRSYYERNNVAMLDFEFGSELSIYFDNLLMIIRENHHEILLT